jgi:hypothetical protein
MEVATRWRRLGKSAACFYFGQADARRVMRSGVQLPMAASLGLLLLVSAANAGSPSAAVLTVSATADAINGQVSSPAALIAHPGSDGISLREAITAVNHSSGRHTITFAHSLAGKTIVVSRVMPALTQNGTALVGLTSAGGEPAVTLDAKGAGPSAFRVFASNVSITHMRIVDVRGEFHNALQVVAGGPGGELDVHGDRVEWNVFDNSGAPGVAVRLGMPDGIPNLTGAVLSDVTVAHNVIQHFGLEGLLLGLTGTHCTAEGVLVEDNTFTDVVGTGSADLELAAGSSDGRIVGTQILRNTFNGGLGVNLNATAGGGTGNVISGTLVSQNVFNGGLAFVLNGGTGGTGNAIDDTEISNDLITQGSEAGSIDIEGGEGGSGNRVDGVLIVNDTLAFDKHALTVVNNPHSSTGNQISNVHVENTIFWSNGTDVNRLDVSTVAPTIVSSLMGIDPRFVSAQDFHLLAGSPAINAGTINGAPATDLDNHARSDGHPDIGAYEFAG